MQLFKKCKGKRVTWSDRKKENTEDQGLWTKANYRLSLMIYAFRPPCTQYTGILTFPTPPPPQTKIIYITKNVFIP